MLKNSENNGTEEIGLVTPTPARWIHLRRIPHADRGVSNGENDFKEFYHHEAVSEHLVARPCASDAHWTLHGEYAVQASQITGVSIICSMVWSGTDQRKHQSSVSLAFVRGIHL